MPPRLTTDCQLLEARQRQLHAVGGGCGGPFLGQLGALHGGIGGAPAVDQDERRGTIDRHPGALEL